MKSPVLARILDGLVALGLIAALLVVFAKDRTAARRPKPSEDRPEDVQEIVTTKFEPLRIAVTPYQFDDMGKLLRGLGSGYSYTDIEHDDLLSPEKLSKFDVLFLTCSAFPNLWGTKEDKGDGDKESGGRPGTRYGKVKPEIEEKLKLALHGFVEKGGTLYASDWRFTSLLTSFPNELRLDRNIQKGAVQSVTALVIDQGLKDIIGSEIILKFDKPEWYPAAIRDDPTTTTTYLRGTYTDMKGQVVTAAPLLIKVRVGSGTIIFTSFHNETANSETEGKLLEYLVFGAITAKEIAKVKETMRTSGFSPQKENILTATPGEQSASYTYKHEQAGPLQFVLGFEPQGARLRLKVVGPGGLEQNQPGTSSFTLIFPEAPAGIWTYTVTAEKLPNPKFPFTVTIGEKK